MQHLCGQKHGLADLLGNQTSSCVAAGESARLCGSRTPHRCCLVAQSCPTLFYRVRCTRQAPASMRFSRQEHWSGLPFPPSGDLPDPGIELRSHALASRFFTMSHLLLLLLLSHFSRVSVRPHRQQPTRLLCPWDSPGKNTGLGCHFLLQCMKVKSESEVTWEALKCFRQKKKAHLIGPLWQLHDSVCVCL